MKFKISGTTKIPRDKKSATFGYKVFETDSMKKFVNFINTHATCPATFKKGHRNNKNIEEVHGWFRIDVDVKGMDKKVSKKLNKAKILYIKKPSTNNDKDSFKWHYLIPVENISQNLDEYKLQYQKFLISLNIDTEWVDMSLNKPVQNMNPYKHGKEPEDAFLITTCKKGKV